MELVAKVCEGVRVFVSHVSYGFALSSWLWLYAALPATADSATLHSCVLWVIISRMGPVRISSPDQGFNHVHGKKLFNNE